MENKKQIIKQNAIKLQNLLQKYKTAIRVHLDEIDIDFLKNYMSISEYDSIITKKPTFNYYSCLERIRKALWREYYNVPKLFISVDQAGNEIYAEKVYDFDRSNLRHASNNVAEVYYDENTVYFSSNSSQAPYWLKFKRSEFEDHYNLIK